jgi:hypothetical protein
MSMSTARYATSFFRPGVLTLEILEAAHLLALYAGYWVRDQFDVASEIPT